VLTVSLTTPIIGESGAAKDEDSGAFQPSALTASGLCEIKSSIIISNEHTEQVLKALTQHRQAQMLSAVSLTTPIIGESGPAKDEDSGAFQPSALTASRLCEIKSSISISNEHTEQVLKALTQHRQAQMLSDLRARILDYRVK